jgi:hypothetical protein
MATLEAIMGGQIPRPSRFREDLPKALDDVVMKTLHLHRDKRFRDCQELALALEDALAQLSVVHSPARLSQYMRRLFADTLAEEATLGLVNPDGSLSKNLTPFTLPPPGGEHADRMDAPREPRPARADDAREDRAEEPRSTRPEATTADRKSSMSRDDSGGRGTKARPPPAQSLRTESDAPADAASDPPTDPTVVEEKRARPRPARTPEARRDVQSSRRGPPARRGSNRVAIAALAMGALAACAVLFAWIAFSSYSASGPGTLVVRSEPRGATVFLDGQPTGQATPALLKGVEAGTPHKLRLELGDKSVEEVVTIPRRGATQEVRLELP